MIQTCFEVSKPKNFRNMPFSDKYSKGIRETTVIRPYTGTPSRIFLRIRPRAPFPSFLGPCTVFLRQTSAAGTGAIFAYSARNPSASRIRPRMRACGHVGVSGGGWGRRQTSAKCGKCREVIAAALGVMLHGLSASSHGVFSLSLALLVIFLSI